MPSMKLKAFTNEMIHRTATTQTKTTERLRGEAWTQSRGDHGDGDDQLQRQPDLDGNRAAQVVGESDRCKSEPCDHQPIAVDPTRWECSNCRREPESQRPGRCRRPGPWAWYAMSDGWARRRTARRLSTGMVTAVATLPEMMPTAMAISRSPITGPSHGPGWLQATTLLKHHRPMGTLGSGTTEGLRAATP